MLDIGGEVSSNRRMGRVVDFRCSMVDIKDKAIDSNLSPYLLNGKANILFSTKTREDSEDGLDKIVLSRDRL